MELETTTIREKITWVESQPIAWDKHQAWMRIERGGDSEEPARRVGYYAAAAVVVVVIAMIASGDYSRNNNTDRQLGAGVTLEGAEGISNIERRISNVEVKVDKGVMCGESSPVPSSISSDVIMATKRGGSPLGARGARRDRVLLSSIEQKNEFILLPEPIDGKPIEIVEYTKPVAERVHAIFGVEGQPAVAIIRQGKKLKIHFLQTEISQFSVVNTDEPSGFEARLNKK